MKASDKSSDPEPMREYPPRRELLTELGRIYLQAGLPLAAACEAALADLQSFGIPTPCES